MRVFIELYKALGHDEFQAKVAKIGLRPLTSVFANILDRLSDQDFLVSKFLPYRLDMPQDDSPERRHSPVFGAVPQKAARQVLRSE